jgi:hypothetical protein
VDARPAPDVYDDEPWELAAAYRVTLWEQPARPPNIDQPAGGPKPFPGGPMGWEEMTFGCWCSGRSRSDPMGGNDARVRRGSGKPSRRSSTRPRIRDLREGEE